ncbi:uncharacterized protein LOC126194351 [Schistocerca nitens]|uniref:uncharacterized protein LOC126194351 n=1 Tax=Schistocerca nitens TaxID=7011 RepID=UPI002117BDED|nr:uncharacterized protein LOC126194351 [Schistocerca nitens]XP_049788717.1 uncharacterized protein LOC126194351 [Schistocerca nitens]
MAEISRRQKILREVRCLHLFCKAVGLVPFSIDMENVKLDMKATDIVYALAIFICLVSTLVPLVLTWMGVHMHGLPAAVYLNAISSFVFLFINIIVVLLEMLVNTSRYRKMVLLLGYCDREFSQSQIGAVDRTSIGWIVGPLVNITVSSMQLVIIAIKMKSVNTLQLVLAYTVNTLVTSGNLFKFYFLLLMARQRIITLNNGLFTMSMQQYGRKRLTEGSSKRECFTVLSQVANDVDDVHFCQSIRSLRRGFEALCSLSDEIFSAHKVFLALLLPTLFMESVCTVFLTCKRLKYGDNFQTTEHTWGAHFVQVTQFLLVLLPAHMTIRQLEDTSTAVFRVLLQTPSGSRPEAELKLFDLQVQRRSPRFSIFGVATLDFRLLTTFVSALTTYVVILFSL